MLFYELFQFKADLGTILKCYCCHGNVLINLYSLQSKSRYYKERHVDRKKRKAIRW